MEALTWQTLLLGLGIFLARVGDVSLGTIRTISIVQGRTKTAFFLGFIEICLWLTVIATVLHDITATPVLGLFYALGFATGNMVGIKLERRLAFGHLILRVITRMDGLGMATRVREAGHAVTTFRGEGRDGPVIELYIVCRRRDFNDILDLVKSIDPTAFYTTEQAGSVSKSIRPMMTRPTGWRAVFKRK